MKNINFGDLLRSLGSKVKTVLFPEQKIISPVPESYMKMPTPTPTKIPTPTVTPPPDKGALPYYQNINKYAKEYNVPQNVFYRMLKRESMNFNPKVINGEIKSPVGALGIAQFMPETAKWLGVDPLNPEDAIRGAAKYLDWLYKQLGDWKLAVAAYNAGIGNVQKYGGIPPFKETQDYVKTVLGVLE
ncbi:MAG: lytic transglycosylase domain-containing protein [Thermoplasmata archaeon]